MLALHLLAEEGPNESLAWLLYAALAFFFLVVVVGWLASRRKVSRPEVRHEAPRGKARKKEDDLARIEGIGPKVVKVLKEAGIVTFEDLANAKASQVQKVLDAAGLHMMNPQGWIEQAKLAEKGDWKAFEKLQAELKGGRKK
jgi:hypothetical protein